MAVDTTTLVPAAPASQPKEEVKTKKPEPINAWYYNENGDLPCMPHQYSPNRVVSQEHLDKLGVLTWTGIETEGFENNEFLNKIKAVRGYNYEEVLTVTPEKLPNYEENTKKFFMEHLHDHEEIRFIIDGVGFEDVRDFDGQWIRIEIKKGVLIVLPPGMYHRFTLDKDLYLKALLLYQETPDRIQFEKNPVTDAMECRLEYVRSVLAPPEEADSVSDKVMAAATKAMEAITV